MENVNDMNNLNSMKVRTDLALELREKVQGDCSGIRVKTRINQDDSIKTTIIDILNKRGEEALGRKKGRYITIESAALCEPDISYHKEICRELKLGLKSMIKDHKNVLLAGIGNRNITADALGPMVIDNISPSLLCTDMAIDVSAICPGVMAQTGLETGDILRAIVKEKKADLLIVFDALSTLSCNRLNKTIQITDTGINPGAGVGNNRSEISSKTMGTDVIAVGVPTVIAVPALLSDSIDRLLNILDGEMTDNNISNGKAHNDRKEGHITFTENEKLGIASMAVPEELAEFFVTPKNVDEIVKTISFTISEAINDIFTPEHVE